MKALKNTVVTNVALLGAALVVTVPADRIRIALFNFNAGLVGADLR